MAVLTRDSQRCSICGRSPSNYVDLELYVHHIVPWGNGGITEEGNLVMLYGACRDGLDPHFDWGWCSESKKSTTLKIQIISSNCRITRSATFQPVKWIRIVRLIRHGERLENAGTASQGHASISNNVAPNRRIKSFFSGYGSLSRATVSKRTASDEIRCVCLILALNEPGITLGLLSA